MKTRKQIILLIILIGAVHSGFLLLPVAPFSVATNLVLFFVNVFVLMSARHVINLADRGQLIVFSLGYIFLFAFLVVVKNKPPLFILLAVLYVGFYGTRRLRSFYWIIVSCFVLFQPFAFETVLPMVLLYLLFWRTADIRLGFVRYSLFIGAAGLAVGLFPVLHLGMQDSVQSLLKTLSRTDVQKAILVSLITSTIATLLLAVWAIPFAYGMARVNFKGKKWVETLIDVPILVPQSIAGVALLVLIGPGSYLGTILESIGFHISGTYLGIIIAQMFVAMPFVVKSSIAAFEAVPLRYEWASRSMGAGPGKTFMLVTFPMASRGVLMGAVLSWARAVSEFGCIVLFASSPAAAPVLVHTEFLRAGVSESRPLAILFLIVCLWAFLLIRFFQNLLPFKSSARLSGV